MKCSEIRKQFSDFIDGELAPDIEALVKEHVAGCADCRTELSRLEKMIGLLKSVEEVEPPRDIIVNVNKMLDKEPVMLRILGFLFGYRQRRFPIKAVAVTIVAILVIYLNIKSPPSMKDLQDSAYEKRSYRLDEKMNAIDTTEDYERNGRIAMDFIKESIDSDDRTAKKRARKKVKKKPMKSVLSEETPKKTIDKIGAVAGKKVKDVSDMNGGGWAAKEEAKVEVAPEKGGAPAVGDETVVGPDKFGYIAPADSPEKRPARTPLEAETIEVITGTKPKAREAASGAAGALTVADDMRDENVPAAEGMKIAPMPEPAKKRRIVKGKEAPKSQLTYRDYYGDEIGEVVEEEPLYERKDRDGYSKRKQLTTEPKEIEEKPTFHFPSMFDPIFREQREVQLEKTYGAADGDEMKTPPAPKTAEPAADYSTADHGVVKEEAEEGLYFKTDRESDVVRKNEEFRRDAKASSPAMELEDSVSEMVGGTLSKKSVRSSVKPKQKRVSKQAVRQESAAVSKRAKLKGYPNFLKVSVENIDEAKAHIIKAIEAHGGQILYDNKKDNTIIVIVKNSEFDNLVNDMNKVKTIKEVKRKSYDIMVTGEMLKKARKLAGDKLYTHYNIFYIEINQTL